jgi:hypothetical protein
VNRFGDIIQKAFYLGVGAVAAATEEAGSKLTTLRSQAQKLADELVAKGEMTTEEARKLVSWYDRLNNSNKLNLPIRLKMWMFLLMNRAGSKLFQKMKRQFIRIRKRKM